MALEIQCADKYLALKECRERSSLYLALNLFFIISTIYYAILRQKSLSGGCFDAPRPARTGRPAGKFPHCRPVERAQKSCRRAIKSARLEHCLDGKLLVFSGAIDVNLSVVIHRKLRLENTLRCHQTVIHPPR